MWNTVILNFSSLDGGRRWSKFSFFQVLTIQSQEKLEKYERRRAEKLAPLLRVSRKSKFIESNVK